MTEHMPPAHFLQSPTPSEYLMLATVALASVIFCVAVARAGQLTTADLVM